MSEVHQVPILSYCVEDGVKKLHKFKRAYKFDGFVPVESTWHPGEPRWLIMFVCTKCRGSYAYDFTYKNPKEKK